MIICAISLGLLMTFRRDRSNWAIWSLRFNWDLANPISEATPQMLDLWSGRKGDGPRIHVQPDSLELRFNNSQWIWNGQNFICPLTDRFGSVDLQRGPDIHSLGIRLSQKALWNALTLELQSFTIIHGQIPRRRSNQRAVPSFIYGQN